jgi:hypothetical protein
MAGERSHIGAISGFSQVLSGIYAAAHRCNGQLAARSVRTDAVSFG